MKENKLFWINKLELRNSIHSIMFIIVIFSLTACGKKQSDKSKMSGNRPVRTKKVSVVTKSIERENVIEYSEITGKLEGIVDIDIIAEVSGKVVSISRKLGDYVKAGDEIARIDNEDIELQLNQAESNTLAAKAKYDSEQIKFKINKQLHEKGSISEVEYIIAKSSFETAKAAYDGALANQKLSERKLRNSLFTAPVSGKIAALPIKVGQYIGIGTNVVSLVDDSKMIIRTGVGPSLIQKIKQNEEVCLTTQFGNKICTGEITGIGSTPGSDNFNYPIEIELENSLGLFSGQLVKGKLQTNVYENVITVNPSSVKNFYDKDFVYVVDSESKVQKRDVVIEAEISEKVIIKSGLEVGDEIIIQGFEFIKEGLKVSVKKLSEIKTTSSKGKKGE